MSAQNILLTGRPGVGKTTLVKRVVELLNTDVGGFYTEEIRTGESRLGFKIKTFTGEERILAHLAYKSPFRVGKYGVDIEALEEVAVPALQEAIAQSQLIVVDEIGRMELYSERLRQTVLQALDSPKPVLGVIQNRQGGFLDQIRRRNDVLLLTITGENRDSLVAKVKKNATVTVHLTLLSRPEDCLRDSQR